MSSGFITEAEIQEKRRLRQEQWEKVRKPEEPKEVPEQPVDTRSLYERLKEQKDKKQEEFEESHKFKNLVKTLDDEEVQFLEYVDQAQQEEEKRKRLEEAKELSEFRNAVSEFRAKEVEKAIQQEISTVDVKKSKPMHDDISSFGTKKTSQSQLLAGLVKRKSVPLESDKNISPPFKKLKTENVISDPGKSDSVINGTESTSISAHIIESVPDKGSLVCIGVLPGLACYDDSSDDDDDPEDSSGIGKPNIRPAKGELIDLCGRKLEFVEDKKKSH